jgi:phosphoesterase RecJ-like protein
MMMKNSTLDDIAYKLREAKTVLIYPHVLMDGDAFGSSVALCCGLKKSGKKVTIIPEGDEGVPSYLAFLQNQCISIREIVSDEPDVCIAVDSSDTSRLEGRLDRFKSGKITINIDHHITNNFFADMNYVDTEASSTGEIIFRLLKAMDIEIDKDMAEGIYVAISTDTGGFQYTNTTKNTHLVVSELFDSGIDLERISAELYENTPYEKLKLIGEILDNVEDFCDGQAVIAAATLKMMENTGALMDQTEGIIELLRSISGVEIACLLKEVSDSQIKVSLRAKTYGDVSKIAAQYKGGGHKKAAGCTVYQGLEEVRKLMKKDIATYLQTVTNNINEQETR